MPVAEELEALRTKNKTGRPHGLPVSVETCPRLLCLLCATRLLFGGGTFRAASALLSLRGFLGVGTLWRQGDGRKALDLDLEGRLHLGMEAEFDLVVAHRTDRLVEMNLLLVEVDLKVVLQLISNSAAGDAAEHLAIVASLHLHQAGELGDALGELAHRVILVRFALGAALAEDFQTALVSAGQRNGQPLGEEVVAGVASGDFDLIGFATEADDVVSEDDFSFCHTKTG